MIPFNKPYLTGKEMHYMYQAVYSGKISGNGIFTKKCQTFFETNYSIHKCLMTSSCTDALEMAAILCDIQPGDEIIMPSYTFVSTPNAFVLRGAHIVFIDSRKDHPGMDEDQIEKAITSKTKAIVPVHYAGVACDMDKIMDLAAKYGLWVVEDAAQAIDSYYTGKDGIKRALGSIGHLAAFSFHETKNIISGEGGMLAVNEPSLAERAEIIWEKGTNRSSFFRGEVDKYGWVDIGSSFLPSDLIAGFLFAQIENLENIQNKRKEIWTTYYDALLNLSQKGFFKMPYLPSYACNNAHMFYLIMPDGGARHALIEYLKSKSIHAVFHYLSLHKSNYYADKHTGTELPYCDEYSDCLIRLPFFYELEIQEVISTIISFYNLKLKKAKKITLLEGSLKEG